MATSANCLPGIIVTIVELHVQQSYYSQETCSCPNIRNNLLINSMMDIIISLFTVFAILIRVRNLFLDLLVLWGKWSKFFTRPYAS